MKLLCLSIFIFLSQLASSQSQLDSSRLAIFGDTQLNKTQINQADSLLISAIDYYNRKAQKSYYRFNLNDSEVAIIDSLVDSHQLLKSCQNKNGKLLRRRLKKFNTPQQKYIKQLAVDDSKNIEQIDSIKASGMQRKDPVVLSWGAGGLIALDKYYRQYIVSKLSNGKMRIQARCICDAIIDEVAKTNGKDIWRKRELKVSDAGNCYFEIELDVDRNEAVKMKVNGI